MMMIPLTEVDGDIIIDPPRPSPARAGVGLDAQWRNDLNVWKLRLREPSRRSWRAHGGPGVTINPGPLSPTKFLGKTWAPRIFRLITSADQAAQLRLSETSKRFFESYELNTALRRTFTVHVRILADVTTTAVENDVAQAFIEAHRF